VGQIFDGRALLEGVADDRPEIVGAVSLIA
jgi:hypothetical protein